MRTSGGKLVPMSIGKYGGNQMALSQGDPSSITSAVSDMPSPDGMRNNQVTVDIKPKRNYLAFIVGALILLFVLGLAERKLADGNDDFKLVGVSVWNFIAVGILATFFSFSAKVIFNKYPVPGVTQILNAS